MLNDKRYLDEKSILLSEVVNKIMISLFKKGVVYELILMHMCYWLIAIGRPSSVNCTKKALKLI